MDDPTTLLVAIMFSTLMVTGIINILMFISEVVAGNRTTDVLHRNWLFLLLLINLSMFWQTTLILEVEGWKMISFLGFMIGPILLLFATNLLCTVPEGVDTEPFDSSWFYISKRFFVLLALVEVWTLGLDYFFASLSWKSWLGVAFGVFLLGLAVSRNPAAHKAGVGFAWLVLITVLIAQSV